MTAIEQKRWQDVFILLLGVWLLFSPFFLNYADNNIAARNSYVLGVGVVLFAILALMDTQKWEEWINLALGVWLLLSPFVLGFSGERAPTWNHLLVGLLIAIDALWLILQSPSSGRRIVS